MRRLNDDDNQDSPDEMTELLSSQDDIGPEVHCSILIFNQTNALRVSFFSSLSLTNQLIHSETQCCCFTRCSHYSG